jgi:hypothetical protein
MGDIGYAKFLETKTGASPAPPNVEEKLNVLVKEATYCADVLKSLESLQQPLKTVTNALDIGASSENSVIQDSLFKIKNILSCSETTKHLTETQDRW